MSGMDFVVLVLALVFNYGEMKTDKKNEAGICLTQCGSADVHKSFRHTPHSAKPALLLRLAHSPRTIFRNTEYDHR